MEYKKLLKKYAEENYAAFKKSMVALPAEKVFENACKVNAYNILSGFFMGDFDLSDDACSFLCEQGNSILDFLYEEYNYYNPYSPESDEDVEDFIKKNYED